MGLLDGKQIRDESISLNKLGLSGLVTFTSSSTMSFGPGTTLTTEDSNIITGIDVVNKNYVDAVAIGLNVKDSSRVIYNGDVSSIGGYTYSNGTSGVGATLTFTSVPSIDGITLSATDRIIINSTTDKFVNGIYDYTTSTTLTRSSDFDGSPIQEVDGGEFSFITEGSVYADTGWIVSSPNSTATIGVTEIIWTQFSSAGVILAGNGLNQIGNTFDVGAGTGLTVSASQVFIDVTGVTASSYGSTNSIPTFTVNSQGQLTLADQVLVDISSSQINDISTTINTEIFNSDNFVDSSTIDFVVLGATGVSANLIAGSLTASYLNTNSQGATAGYVLSVNTDGTFIWTDPSLTGDITDVTAGTGLTGGGSSGNVSVSFDFVSVVGDGLTQSGGVISTDFQSTATSLQGQGLTSASGILNVDLSPASGLTFSSTGESGTLQLVTDGTTITVDGSGQLVVVGGSSQPYYGDRNLIPNTTAPVTDDEYTGLTINGTPSDYSNVNVYVNGQLQIVGDGVTTSDCYFGTTASAVAITSITAGDKLYWNGSIAGFRLSTTDRVSIVYES